MKRCPSCFQLFKAVNGSRNCSNCGCEVPDNFGKAREVNICVLGRQNSGKTVFLSVLLHELSPLLASSPLRERAPTLDVRHHTTETQRAEKNNYCGWIYDRKLLPPRTKPRQQKVAELHPLIYETRLGSYVRCLYPIPRTVTFNLYLHDSAGDDSHDQRDFDRDHPALMHADGLIVFFSGLSVPQLVGDSEIVPDKGNFQFLNIIRGYFGSDGDKLRGGRIKIPTAFVLTKLDDDKLKGLSDEDRAQLVEAPDHSDGFHLSHCQHTSEMIHSLVGRQAFARRGESVPQNVVGSIEDRFLDYMIFGISSLGHAPNEGFEVVEGESESLRKVNPARIQAMNLFSPLLWIFHRLGLLVRR